MIKTSVWSINIIGPGGIGVETDYKIGINDEGLAAFQLGHTDIIEEDLKNLKNIDEKIEETVVEVAIPIIKPEIRTIVQETIQYANLDGGEI